MTTGMTKHFTFHVRWIVILIYFNFLSASFYIIFLSDGNAMSINKHCLVFNYYVCPTGRNLSTCLYP